MLYNLLALEQRFRYSIHRSVFLKKNPKFSFIFISSNNYSFQNNQLWHIIVLKIQSFWNIG